MLLCVKVHNPHYFLISYTQPHSPPSDQAHWLHWLPPDLLPLNHDNKTCFFPSEGQFNHVMSYQYMLLPAFLLAARHSSLSRALALTGYFLVSLVTLCCGMASFLCAEAYSTANDQ